MSYLRYLCLFACSGVLCLVYPMLPVSLDCPLFFVPAVFSDVYLEQKGGRKITINNLVKFHLSSNGQ